MADGRVDGPSRGKRARAERPPGEPSTQERSPQARAADHAAIEGLAGDLLPALVAKLADSGLGEIEIREGSWRVRVRRPGDGGHLARRASDRASRAQPGHAGHGHQPAGFEGHRSTKDARDGRETRPAAGSPTNGSTPAGGLVPVGPGGEPAPSAAAEDEGLRTVATSPAVGVYQPRPDAKPGSHVRAGDRLGSVNMLGIPQEVVAPIDGVVGSSLVDAGQAVEYGQELVVIEPVQEASSGGSRGGRPDREA